MAKQNANGGWVLTDDDAAEILAGMRVKDAQSKALELLQRVDGILGLCRHRENVSIETKRDIDAVRSEIAAYEREVSNQRIVLSNE